MGNCYTLKCVKKRRLPKKVTKQDNVIAVPRSQPVASGLLEDENNNTLPLLLITEATPLSQVTTDRRRFLSSINVIKSGYMDIPSLSIGEFVWQHLLSQAADQPALGIYNKEKVTYGQLIDSVRVNMQILNHLLNPTLDESVLLMTSSSISAVSLLLASHRLNVRAVVINPNQAEILTDDLKTLNIRCLFASGEYMTQAQRLREVLEIQQCFVIDSDADQCVPSNFRSPAELQNSEKLTGGAWKALVNFWCDKDPQAMPVLTLWTMGRSDRPKMVHLTNKNLISSVYAIRQLTQLDRHSKLLDLLPLYHPFSLTLGVYNSLISGCQLLMLAKVSPEEFLRCVEHERVYGCILVPSILEFLAFNDMAIDYDLSGLEVIFTTVGPVSDFVTSTLYSRIPRVNVYNAYGMCETTSITHIMLSPDRALKSVGPLLPNMECKIMNLSTGKAECPGKPGEILLRGPVIAQCVTDDATQLTYLDNYGWLHTGDIGFYDQDENFYITGNVQTRLTNAALRMRQQSNYRMEMPDYYGGTPVCRDDRNVLERVVPRKLLTFREESDELWLSDNSLSE